MDYYEVLNLHQYATSAEIKTSFRNKLKILHPDTDNIRNFQKNTENNLFEDNTPELSKRRMELIQIIQAYEVLSSPIKRRMYDESREILPSFIKRKNHYFDYEKFLLNRQHIFKYKAKLFLHELIFKSGKRAMQIYENILKQKTKVLLKAELGRLDYTDCMILLSELYQQSSDIKKLAIAIDIYLELFHQESMYSYFNETMLEIIQNILNIIEDHSAILSYKKTQLLLNEIRNFKLPKKMQQEVESYLCDSQHKTKKRERCSCKQL